VNENPEKFHRVVFLSSENTEEKSAPIYLLFEGS
jgi:hypothetical protein